MKTKLILLDTPVIVSDKKILNNDLCLYLGRFGANILCKAVDTKTGRVYQELNINPIEEYGSTDGGIIPSKSEILKIIAGIEGLPSIDWNGLEGEFGWIDVNVRDITLEAFKQGITFSHHQFSDDAYNRFRTWFSQNKKAQSLNEKKFSLEDMRDMLEEGINWWGNGRDTDLSDSEDFFDRYIQSLQQHKVFDIKVELLSDSPYDPRSKTGRFEIGDTDKVVIRNNSIKILKKL